MLPIVTIVVLALALAVFVGAITSVTSRFIFKGNDKLQKNIFINSTLFSELFIGSYLIFIGENYFWLTLFGVLGGITGFLFSVFDSIDKKESSKK